MDVVIESAQATRVWPPRQLWLPPLGEPPTADELVARASRAALGGRLPATTGGLLMPMAPEGPAAPSTARMCIALTC